MDHSDSTNLQGQRLRERRLHHWAKTPEDFLAYEAAARISYDGFLSGMYYLTQGGMICHTNKEYTTVGNAYCTRVSCTKGVAINFCLTDEARYRVVTSRAVSRLAFAIFNQCNDAEYAMIHRRIVGGRIFSSRYPGTFVMVNYDDRMC
ncbi:hypothetical protein CDD80_4312 [Ophiocordyceps camponoti-rufipedis]|uniref:Uncharacterized protein n=1 Tax=Ophiocordyceps camponoti-rufipedis TaxID=2004952 RepID=A0A2C5YSD3_9HYPO|nr:hypothetical protein CDD80_4312 [Ophiocordyceps camponoti-rufipedis]